MKTKLLLMLGCLVSIRICASSAKTFTFTNPCTPFISATAIGNTYGCYSFTASNAGATDPSAYYTWNFGDGATATGTIVSHCYNPVNVPTVFTVTVQYHVVALCGPVPTHNTFTLSLLPPQQGQCVGNSPSVTVAAPSATVWSGSAIPENMQLVDYGDNTTGPANTGHTYTPCGNYIITVKTWNMNTPENVCFAYAAVNMTCAGVPSGFEENARGKEIVLFPNPTTSRLSVNRPLEVLSFKVTGINGQTIVEQPFFPEHGIELEGLTCGMYFVELTLRENNTQRFRILKN